MASGAVVRKLSDSMIGVLHAVEIRLVTLPAIGVDQLVIAVDVTGLAGLGNVRALQRELRRGVIEGRGLPGVE